MKTSSPQASQRADSRNNQTAGQTRRNEPQRGQQQSGRARVDADGSSRISPFDPGTEQPSRNLDQQGQDRSGQSSQESQEIRETVAHEEIARRAHELWEQDGRQDGRDQEHWLEAEKQLRGSSFRGSADFERGDAHAEARAIKASAERRERGQASN